MATTDPPTTLASLLKQRRTLRNRTQAEAAKEIGVSTRAYRMYENGEVASPHATQRKAIARFLDVDEAELSAALNGLAMGAAAENIRDLVRELVQEELARERRSGRRTR